MKLTFNAAAPQGEEWQRKNRQARIYLPPDDGREWILVDDAAKLYGIKPHCMMVKANKLDFTRTFRKGIKTWLLKSDVMRHLDFLQLRERWYKNHRPKCWRQEVGSCEGESDEFMQRVFCTSAQAAAFMGVSPRTVWSWAKKGKIPVFVNRKMGKGGKCWFSWTSLRNYKEDEERLKYRARWEKNLATRQAGIVHREVYNQRHRPQVYKKPIPDGWMTVREAAELLNVSRSVIHRMVKQGAITVEHFTGEWDAKRRPWFILRTSLEGYIETEFYQRKHKVGKEVALGQIGIFPADGENQTLRASPSFREEMIAHRERFRSSTANPDIW